MAEKPLHARLRRWRAGTGISANRLSRTVALGGGQCHSPSRPRPIQSMPLLPTCAAQKDN
eukprot:10452759-Lingulodinium_polyedra.AAC.1